MIRYAAAVLLFLLFFPICLPNGNGWSGTETLLPVLGQKAEQWSLPINRVEKDDFRLSLVESTMARPWLLRGIVDSLASSLLENSDPLPLYLNSLQMLGLTGTPRGLTRVSDQLKGLPKDWPRELVRSVSVLAACFEELEKLPLGLDRQLLNDILDGLLPWPGEETASPCELSVYEQETDKRSREALGKIDLDFLHNTMESATLLLWGAERTVQMLESANRTSFNDLHTIKSSSASGDLLFDKTYSWGRVLIGGPGPTTYKSRASLIIDLGGDDIYLAPVGSGAGENLLSVCIDLSGDDFYSVSDDAGVAAAIGGVGIVLDLSGNDTYRSGDISLGAALGGVGILVDYEGDDVFTGRDVSQGSGLLGVGMLIDLDGNDRFSADFAAQGFGYVGGAGVLVDRSGNDSFFLGGPHTDILRYDDHSLSMGQGFGFGYRPAFSGGVGLLVDGAGNDTYRADIFAQGASYWYGLGGLVDRSGNDLYAAYQYVQGSGVHLAVAALIDRDGDDSYLARGVSQGCGHDLAIGHLFDSAGDDMYVAYDLSQGAGSANGIGILEDISGNDAYVVRKNSNSQGYGNPRRHSGSIGILWDKAGDDVFSAAPPSQAWSRGFWGLGWDAQSPSALNETEPAEADSLTLSEVLASCTGVSRCEALFLLSSRGEPRFAEVAAAARDSIIAHPAPCMSCLFEALSSERPRDKWTLENLFRKLGPNGRNALLQHLSDGKERLDAPELAVGLWVLGRVAEFEPDSVDSFGSVDSLLSLASHNSEKVRASLAYVLAESRIQSTSNILRMLSVDPEPSVRREAVRGLSLSSRDEAVDLLLLSLNDPNPGVRHAAVSTLASIDQSAIGSITSLSGERAQAAILASISLFSEEESREICSSWAEVGSSDFIKGWASSLIGRERSDLSIESELDALLRALATARQE